MIHFLLFSFAAIGLTNAIVDGRVFQWLRDSVDKYMPKFIQEMIHCYQCTGFWVGLLVGWMVFQPSFWLLLCYGWASSFLSTYAALYFNYLEAKTIINLPEK